ncbi:hypothetical protein G7084_01465 [Weissella coleopterorum]|uniref:Uncharacterized protein n=1 Tax=Weissella coleopterorum TaxID=2714949 RepID=A0A6G8AYH0_9LACO|nr:hypothetical protein [Weissella coleopterorum]QIL50104.1 hypothetical protein G7084_01465 [Weissella coleopterorum]
MIDWYALEEEHKKISFEYQGETIVGIVSAFFDGEDDEPEERDLPWFALEGFKIAKGYGIDKVSNVKILD